MGKRERVASENPGVARGEGVATVRHVPFAMQSVPAPSLFSSHGVLIGGILLLSAALIGCGKQSVVSAETLHYELVATYSHDVQAFTQGLLFHEGKLYESTGGYGRSTLRRVDPESGRAEEVRFLPDSIFGEGLALRDGELYQLEWTSGIGRIYDLETLRKTGEFQYEGQGWGLTFDGEHFVLSDGSSRLRFYEPEEFRLVRTLVVTDENGEIDELNELEFIDGEVFANRWYDDEIVRIDPESGRVTGRLSVVNLQRPRPADPDAVANGIAWDPENRLLYVTGKRWPNLYVLRLVEAAP